MTLLLWSEAGRGELCGLYSDVMRGPSQMNGSIRPHIPPSHQNTLLIRVHLPHSITHWLYYPRRTAYSSWPWAGPGGSPELPALQSLGGRAAWSLKPTWATPWTLSLGYRRIPCLGRVKNANKYVSSWVSHLWVYCHIVRTEWECTYHARIRPNVHWVLRKHKPHSPSISIVKGHTSSQMPNVCLRHRFQPCLPI